MATHRFNDIRRSSPAKRAEIAKAVEREVLEMNLRAFREMIGKTQSEAADAASMTQSELSRTERREDHLLSTLRRYVEALGGEVEVIAKFENKTVRLVGV